MIRERLIFDTCAAPFGTGYFFSCRTCVYSRRRETLAPAVVLGLVLFCYSLRAACQLATGAVFRGDRSRRAFSSPSPRCFGTRLRLGLSDLDAALIKTPVIGPIYECWFRKETYFRTDTRLLYLDTVPKVIKRLAEEATAANGVKLTRQYEQAPILGELYKPVPVPRRTKVIRHGLGA